MVEVNYSNMEYRYLGNTGLKVSILSYGNMMAMPTQESVDFQKAAIKKLLELGVNFIDTAEFYGAGAAETNLGTCLKELNVKRE